MRFVRTPFALVVGFVTLAAAFARADRVETVVPLGVPATSQIAKQGDVVTIGFLVTQGTARKVSLAVKRAGKGSKIVPTVAVFDPDGQPFDIVMNGGKVSKAGAPAWAGSFPDVPKSGLWRFEVRGDAGSVGGFSATVKGKDTLKVPAPKSAPVTLPLNGKIDVPIEAGENTALTVAAKRAPGSQVLVQLTVLDANGKTVAGPVLSNPKSGALSLKGLRLPTFGAYTLRFTGGATGGSFIYAASTAPAKIKGAAPTATVDPTSTEPLLSTALSGHATPAAGGALTYRWVQVSGDAVSLVNPDTLTPTFTAPDKPTSLAFQFSVVEGTLVSKPVTVSVEVAKRPIAVAGPSQSVGTAAAVALDGSGSLDRRGSGLKYSWRQVPGDATNVALTGADTASPTLTAPNAAGVLHFGLVVDDGVTTSGEDVVVVNVGDATKSVADAGRDQYVPRMTTVHLCGLASVTPSGVLDLPIQWTQVSGPTITLAGATTPWPSFTAPKTASDLVFKMTVDGNDAAADTVAVHVRADETNLPAPAKGNGPLTSGPGNQSLQADSPANPTVDPNAGDTAKLKFRWGQVRGAPLALTNATSADATAAMIAGNAEYTFAVQATDGLQWGAPDLVELRSPGFSGKPIAIAGPDRSVVRGGPVSLDGRTSARTDGGAGPLTYQWTQLSCKDWFDFAASSATFNPTVAQPSVQLPADVSSLTSTRTVLFQLVVDDGTTSSSPDFVTVTYTSLLSNGLPTVSAVPSDDRPVPGEVVTLQGTSFDRDGDPLTYRWTQTQGTPVTLQPNATVLSPTFVAPSTPSLTDLKFTVIANDGIDDGPVSSPIVVSVNQPPVAVIVKSPQSGPPGTVVSMDGSSSSDPDHRAGDPALTYSWRQISGTSVGIADGTPTSTISFTAPSGAVVFGLKVFDGKLFSTEATQSFSPAAPVTVNPTATNIDTSATPTGTSAATAGVAGFAAYGATVTLNANASGGSGTLSYTWRVVSQSPAAMPTISITNGTTASPTFSVPTPPSTSPFGLTPQATFGVTATDGTSTSSESQIKIQFFASFSNGSASSTTTTIYGTVIGNCTSCHTGTASSTGTGCFVGSGTSATGYGMANPTAFLNNSRGVPSCTTGVVRLPNQGSTGQSSTSYTFMRVKGTASPQMPTTGALSNAVINFFQDWIDQGVRGN
jgi:hypothetical protein